MKRLVRVFYKENLFLIALMSLAALGMVYSNFMRAELLNALINFDRSGFIQASLVLFASFLFFLVFTYFTIIQQNKLIQKKLAYLREGIVEGLANMSYQKYKENPTGAYLAYLTTDLKQIEQQTLTPFYEVVEGVVGALLAGISLFYFHWSLVLLMAIEIIILIQLPKLFSKRVEGASQELAESNEKYVSRASEFLGAYDTFFSFRSFAFFKKYMGESSTALADANTQYGRSMGKVAVVSGLGNIISQVSIFVWTGYLALTGLIGIGSLTATMGLAASIFNIVGNISQYLAMIQSTKPIFEKFEKILDEKEQNDLTHSLVEDNYTKGLKVEELSFSYDQQPVLVNFSYFFEPGKKYALIGASGSGKSTLFNLLTARLEGYSGEIQLNGQDLLSYGYDTLYKQMAYVNQEPDFINLSVRENLLLGDFYTDQEIWKSLEEANLDEFVETLPKGLETILSEGGSNWSGGQLQRLSIARALLRKKTILFLDEPTSKLDAKSAEEVERVLLNAKNVTVIMITHHLRDKSRHSFDDIISLSL